MFVSHVDGAIESKRFELAIQLSQTYINNIEKRGLPNTNNIIISKIIEWDKALFQSHKTFFNSTNGKSKNIIIREPLTFSNWKFFRNEFLKNIIKASLNYKKYDFLNSFEVFYINKNNLQNVKEINDHARSILNLF